MVDNKRGEQMTLTTIIVIVLGVVLLVLLIFGFSTGWKNLWDKVTQFGGGSSSNVAAVVQGCALACDAKDKTAFCSDSRTLKDGKETVIGSCANFAKYGVEVCNEFACGDLAYEQTCEDLGGGWEERCNVDSEEPITLFVKKDIRSEEDKYKKPACCK